MTNAAVATALPVRRRIAIVLASIAAVALAVGPLLSSVLAVRHAVAYATMTQAIDAVERAEAAYAPVVEAVDEAAGGAEADLALAQELAAAADDPYVRAEPAAALVTAAGDLAALLAEVGEHEPSFAPLSAPPYFTADLDAVTAAAGARAAWYREHTESAADLEDELREGTAAVRAAAEGVYASAAELSPGIDTANWVATVHTRVEFRHSADSLAGASLDRDGVDAFAHYLEAAAALEASNQAELDSFAGPLYENRLAAQQFANSIAGGVFLDFDWVPELFGFGGSNGMAGQASLESDGTYFFSSITLTDSVAVRWGDGRAESIVAHEVGHAITLKCIDIFTAHADGDYEAFATAWAIGIGYDTPSNGQAAYGRPSDALIAATMACR